MTRDDRMRSLGVSLTGLIEVCLLLSLVGTGLGFLGNWWWLFDLFSHFRLQYLAVSIMAVAWFMWRRNTWGTGASAAALLVNMLAVLSLWPQVSRGEVAPGKRLRIVSINVLTANRHMEGVLEYVRSVDPDVIFLMEVNLRWVRALEPLKQSHPHFVIEQREDNFGVALFCKTEPIELRTVEVGDAGVPSIHASVEHESRRITMFFTHPLPPTSAETSSLRNNQLEMAGQWVVGIPTPAMVMGDLNVTPWSHGMRILQGAGADLDFRSTEAPWKPTWKVGSPLAIPIDHALATKSLAITKRDVGPDIGSDHRPLLIEVGFVK